MSGSSRSRVLKAIGGGATVVVAFALIGAGVQLARNAEGYEVQTAALEEIDGAPATVIDDGDDSVAPRPPVIPTAEAAVPPAPRTDSTPPPDGGNTDGGGGDGSGGGSDDPTDPDVPPELEPIIGLVDEITTATGETLGGTTESESDETLIDSTVDPLVDNTTETLDDATSSLGL
jgi:hypothetical protein